MTRAAARVGLSDLQRFRLLVYQHGDCWEWRGTRRPDGYGVFRTGTGKPVRAQRFAYEIAKGPLPGRLVTDHLCRHHWCVRPSHLEAVTNEQNVQRGVFASPNRGIRSREKTHCPAGHQYDAANTWIEKKGQRHCRTCHRDRERARYRRLHGLAA